MADTTAMDIDLESPMPPAAIPIESDNETTNPATNKAKQPIDPNDPDPIVASYNVYTNAPLPENRKLLILQQANNSHTSNRAPPPQISEVRLKADSGFIEVDYPMAHGNSDYDRDKGLRWGGALGRSVAAKNGGTHGLAGGFGVGVPNRAGGGGGAGGAGAGRGAGKRQDDLERELSMLDWSEAVRQDKVLRTRTLGGQFPIENETNCRWMVGVFKGDQLHLTPATSLINLRPQLHYVDALAEQERLSRARENASAAGPGPGAGGAAAGKEGAGPQGPGGAAKAIHMSIKSAGAEGGEAVVDTMIERLRKVQVEQWSKLHYEDEESYKAWNVFHQNFLYSRALPRDADDDNDDKNGNTSKGKGKETATKLANIPDINDEANHAALPRYQAQWSETDFLKAVSGMTSDPQADAKNGDDDIEIKAEVINLGDAAKKSGAAARGGGGGKGKAPTAAASALAGTASSSTAAKKGARGKSVTFKE